jgi:guanylate kinase
MDKSWRRIIISGKGGSGKDYLVKLLKEKGLTYSVSHTSRPPRAGEFNGVDYYFVSYEEALGMANSGDFYEWVEFNTWFYGTSLDEFYRANLFIMTPSGIEKLKPQDREESLIIFIDIDENVLRERLALRNDADKAERRIDADREDFKNFSDFDCIITNQNFTLGEVLEKIGLKND